MDKEAQYTAEQGTGRGTEAKILVVVPDIYHKNVLPVYIITCTISSFVCWMDGSRVAVVIVVVLWYRYWYRVWGLIVGHKR
ncbi:hypothetical protein B9Z19DRAFT_1076780 [Tuber borchii]|uniref:Uncharacterized protein n=1 Tax=Tuber borchii TaxID=42251 RepID=A0A2T7A1E8_TUBBO|nr:hypothetical protein B9Z19DRAFT_1076780 [Tuber borchii]